MKDSQLLDLIDDCLHATAIHRKALEQADNRELDDVAEGLSITYSKLLVVAKELELREKR